MIDFLPNALGELDVRLRRLSAGHTEQVICPKCYGGKTKEASLSVTIDPDGMGAVMKCHRGTCGWKHSVRHKGPAVEEWQFRPKSTIRKPAAHTQQQETNRPDWLYTFFADRRIGARTVDHFGIYTVTRKFPDPIGESRSIVFPFFLRGEVVNRKYRPHPAKTPQLQERDAQATLFNVDSLGDSPEEIVWVEGEPDVMALFECGISHAVSLKDGAPAKQNDGEKRYEALRTHGDILEKAKRVVLAGDTDKPGVVLREELARRLGRHRCYTALWPEGCKDACDTLKEHGPDAVVDAIRNAVAYPIEGLHRIQAGTLLTLRRRPAPPVMTTGVHSTDSILKLPAEGRLCVITGYPSAGKTSWTRFMMMHTAQEFDRRWVVFSPEHQPWEHFAAQCAEVYIGKTFYPHNGNPGMTDAEIQVAENWLSNHVTMMVCDAEHSAPTLDWILEKVVEEVLRSGATDLLVDPWNEIDHQRGDQSETDYTGRALQRFRAFAQRHGCNVWIVAHPAKPFQKNGEKLSPPGPYSISGSSHWANKTDLGITVFSPAPGGVELHVWKSRFRRWARKDSSAPLEFDEMTGRYSSAISDFGPPPAWMKRSADYD